MRHAAIVRNAGLRQTDGVLRSTTVFCLLAAALAATANEYPRLSRSLFWQPYASDAATLALFHLDELAPQTAMPDFDALETPAAPALGGLDLGIGAAPARGAADSRTTANAVPMGRTAALLGDGALIAEGYAGGGLRVSGAGALAVQGVESTVPFRTLEFWVRPDALPDAPRVLAELGPAARGSWARLMLNPDGALAVAWMGAAPAAWPGARLQAGVWTHLAFGISGDWPTGDTLRLHLNGQPLPPVPITKADATTATRQPGSAWIGADRDGRNGISGALDIVRLSRTLRAYYPYEPLPASPAAETPAEADFLRDPADLLFHLGFHGSTVPLQAAPKTTVDVRRAAAELENNPAARDRIFPEGMGGRGLMLGDGGLRPQYSAAGNILPQHGTIAFWMQPVDWDNFTRDNRFDAINPTTFGLFQLDCTTVPGSHEAIFRKVGPLLQFTVNLHLPEDAGEPPPLHPGVWNHLAASWVGKEFTYFLNGRRINPDGAFEAALEIRTAGDPYPYKNASARWWAESEPVTLRFRENTYWEQRGVPMPRTVLDDFRIYRRPLSPSEIANLAALRDPRRVCQPLPAADMEMHWNGVSGRIRATVTPLGKDYEAVDAVAVSVVRAGGGEPVGASLFKLDDLKQGRGTVETPPLAFDTYTVVAELQDAAGGVRGRVEESFTRTPPPWWQNRAGLSERVMPPWTPVVASGDTLAVWGRTIRFGGDGLPQQILSQGQNLLAAPIRLDARRGAAPLPLTPAAAPHLRTVGETCGEARGELRGPDFAVTVAARLEFDGMLWFEVTLTPDAGAAPSLDRLTLLLPRTAASARTIHWWSGQRNFRDPKVVHIGDLPAGDGELFRSDAGDTVRLVESQRGSFIPYLLLTGDERGLAWFAENDSGWTQTAGTPAVSVSREADTVILALNVIAERITLDAPRRFAFGLHPTPVRPTDPLWRKYPVYSNVFPDTFSGNNLKGRKGPTAFYLYPEDDWESVKRRIDGEGLTKGAAGIKGHYLSQLKRLADAGIPAPPPQTLTVPGLYWDMQWNGIPPQLGHTREWAEAWAPDYQYYTPAFIDFCSWAWNDWIAKTDKFVQGAYIDDCWGAPLTKAGGPTTHTLPDGHVQPGFQFLGPRERFKRMRQISLDHGLTPHLTAHTTHTYFIPYHSFFDLILDGEDHYSEPPHQSDFLDHWSPARLRFMNGTKWGLVTTWLGWTGNSTPTGKYPAWTFRQTRAYRAGLALHDILWAFDDQTLDAFGLREPDTAFLAYWREPAAARHSHPDLKVAAWKRAGRALLLLVNLGDARIEAEVTPDAAALGFAPGMTLRLLDRDPDLLTYFDEDVTTVGKPALDADPAAEAALNLERDPKTIPLAERRAADPDGRFEWKNGVLRCPVRRHDYRLFEITASERQ